MRLHEAYEKLAMAQLNERGDNIPSSGTLAHANYRQGISQHSV